MTNKHTITFALSSIKDLEEIREWYAEQQVPDVGERLLGEIVSQVESLADFPETGRIVPEFGVAHLREIVYPPFRIVYRLGENRVRIVRVWRSERLLKLEDEIDARTVAEFHEAYTAGREFLVPDEIMRRELAGESPVKLWREHSGLTQQELAKRAGISKPYLSQIETGKRQGTVETLSAIARSLDVPLDVLTD
jgi:plasmid stabilization system protein ParE/DNA-binding XRE family transcriptional regulator